MIGPSSPAHIPRSVSRTQDITRTAELLDQTLLEEKGTDAKLTEFAESVINVEVDAEAGA
jgi:ferritin-like metal-binding protein YciE